MTELDLTSAARSRLGLPYETGAASPITMIEFVTVYMDENGERQERPIDYGRSDPHRGSVAGETHRIELDEDL